MVRYRPDSMPVIRYTGTPPAPGRQPDIQAAQDRQRTPTNILVAIHRRCFGGTQVKIRNFQEWKQIFRESRFSSIKIYDYYEDLFRRHYSFGEKVKLTYKLLYHMIVNKEIRQKIVPPLKFAKKFQKALKGDNYRYLIFTGQK